MNAQQRAEIIRWVHIGVGWVLIVLGIVLSPLPGPQVVISAAGMIMVMRKSRWARKYFIRMQRRYPHILRPIRDGVLRQKTTGGFLRWFRDEMIYKGPEKARAALRGVGLWLRNRVFG